MLTKGHGDDRRPARLASAAVTESNESKDATVDEPGLDPAPESADGADPAAAPVMPGASDATVEDIDLDGIERDLDDVQTALDRLADGTYWTDEVTGEPIADDVLVEHPTARSATER